MKTLIDMFAESGIWRRQLKEVERLRSDLHKVINLTHVIEDNVVREQLNKIVIITSQRLQVARFKMEVTEKRILDTYTKLVNDRVDYSAYFDDEYFIEKIDLDGYLRGTIL